MIKKTLRKYNFNSSSGYIEFLHYFETKTKPILESHIHSQQFQLNLRALLIAVGEDASEIDIKPLGGKNHFLIKIFSRFIEVLKSFDRIRKIRLMIGFYPDNKYLVKHSLDKSDILAYHIENYIQEHYLLCERIKTLLTELAKGLNKYYGNASYIKKFPSKAENFKKKLKPIIFARRIHTHKGPRFSDKNIERLSIVNFLYRYGAEHVTPIAKSLKETSLKQAEKHYLFSMSKSNKKLGKLLSLLFKGILKDIKNILDN